MINNAFTQTNLSVKNIDLIVCDIGPGSFTGIRIGISTAKAFHDSLKIPCIGVSSLESLSYNIKEDLKNGDYICSIIDCKNKNCYYAIYQLNNSQIQEIISPKTDTINNLKKETSKYKNITFIGDGIEIYQEQLSSSTASISTNNILNSYNLGLCGLDKYNNKNFCELLPLYLKKPQAQSQLEEKMLKNNS